jgi:hypothetical protein
MNAHQLAINELLNETSSSSEDESYLDFLFTTNAESNKSITKIVNFKSTVVAAWDNQQFRKVFRMNRSSMQFIAFEFLISEDYPSRLCKIQSMAENGGKLCTGVFMVGNIWCFGKLCGMWKITSILQSSINCKKSGQKKPFLIAFC